MQLQYVFLTEYSFNVANSVLLKPTQPCKSLHTCQATPFYKQKKETVVQDPCGTVVPSGTQH